MKKTTLFALLSMVFCLTSFAQGTAINASGTAADNSSMLDVSAADKGILIPRIALNDTSDATTIPLPASSLLVYNTTSGNGLVPGYFYNAGTSSSPRWKQLLPNPSNSDLNMANFKITNLATCTNNLDAANKAYVDAQISQVGGAGSYALPVMLSDESPTQMTFRQACEYCKNLTERGYSDWRMPTYHEFWQAFSNETAPINLLNSGNALWLMDRDNQYNNYHVYTVISNGSIGAAYSVSTYSVRCVR